MLKTDDGAHGWLAAAGVRPTKQRLALAACLIGDGDNRHVTAERLFEEVRVLDETVSLATVYNALRVFRDAGLLREIQGDGQRVWFDTRVDEHAHYLWEDSGQLSDAPSDFVQEIALPSPPEGSEITKVDVIIRLRSKS